MTQALSGFDREHHHSVWRGALAGSLSGLVGAWVMNQFQTALSKPSSDHQAQSFEDTTVKAAGAIIESALDRPLTLEEKQVAGPIVHYSVGSTVGALYGVVTELIPQASTAWGMPFGAAVWLGADEIGVPAVGLSKSPFDYPVSTHVSALAAHVVYGVTTDLVRRAIRAAL